MKDRAIRTTTLNVLHVAFNILVVTKLIALHECRPSIVTDRIIDPPAFGRIIATNDEATNHQTIDPLHHPTNRGWLGSTKLHFRDSSKTQPLVGCVGHFTRHTNSSRSSGSANRFKIALNSLAQVIHE